MSSESANILLIMSDQQRMDSIGAYAAELARTPTLDGLARRGTRFTQAYTPVTVCSPARASVFTGLYPFQHNVVRNGARLCLDLPNLATALLHAGYRLGYAGKWHIDNTYGPTYFGFHADDWLGYAHPAGGIYLRSFRDSRRNPVNHYLEYLAERGLPIPTLEEAVYFPAIDTFEIYGRQTGPLEASYEHYVAEEAIDLIERFAARARSDGEPFFLWVNFWGPHVPYILPEPYFSMFSPGDVTLSSTLAEGWEGKPWIQKRMSTHNWGTAELDEDTWREVMAKYAGYCALLDWETERILTRLEELGILENTIVAYTTDHGSMAGRHRLVDKGPYPYDDIQRIPMIVAGPGVETGRTVDEFVYLHDLTPTILDWAGAERFPCAGVQSLIPVLSGGRLEQPRDDLYMVRHHHPFPCEQRFLRTRRYKYAYNELDIDELYDLEVDPSEMNNCIGDPTYRDVLDEMIERMWQHIGDLSDPIAYSFNVLARRRGQ
jgi:arylsulfatase A-like enzyme